MYASCSNGIIKVFDTRDGNLVCIFESENIQTKGGGRLTERCVRGFNARDNLIYYGDDGVNIKVLNWRTGKCTVGSGELAKERGSFSRQQQFWINKCFNIAQFCNMIVQIIITMKTDIYSDDSFIRTHLFLVNISELTSFPDYWIAY